MSEPVEKSMAQRVAELSDVIKDTLASANKADLRVLEIKIGWVPAENAKCDCDGKFTLEGIAEDRNRPMPEEDLK